MMRGIPQHGDDWVHVRGNQDVTRGRCLVNTTAERSY